MAVRFKVLQFFTTSILLGFFGCFTFVFGQSFVKKETEISVTDKKKIEVPKLEILNRERGKEKIIVFDTGGGTASKEHYTFEEVTLNFNTSIKALSIGSVRIRSDSGFVGKSIILAIRDGSGETVDFHTLRFVEKKEKVIKSLEGYYIAGGASFDFVDGLQLARPSYEMNVFIPNIFRMSSGGALFRWGIEGNVYRNRSVSQFELATTRLQEEPLFPPAADSTFKIVRKFAQGTLNTSYDNLGLNFGTNYLIGNPHSIAKASDAQSNQFRAFWLTHLEVIQSTVNSRIDSVKIQKVDTIPGHLRNRNIYRRDLDERWFTQVAAYFGTGLMVNYFNDDFDIRIKGIVGLNDRGFKNPAFFLVAFNFVEKRTGIRLGGNVRGSLAGTSPYIDVYLQKVFNANDIFGPLLKGLK